MLTSLTCLFVRNGRNASVLCARFPRPQTQRTVLSPWVCQSSTAPSDTTVCQSASKPKNPPLHPAEQENFGSLSAGLSSRISFKKSHPDIRDQHHEEEEPERVHRRLARRNTTYWYFLQCKKLIKENKLEEALELFSSNMLQGERLQPEEYNYSVLIGGCGRAGNIKKAFRLYNDMKKRGLDATDATYTALFNACAESPSHTAGLQQALKLEQELRRKNYPLSTVTYHALLKTHAVTNHLQACLHILREMLQNRHMVTQETIHYLLMGCFKDKDNGFRLALQVWRQMLHSGILPDAKNYNLLLRTARDCGIGDPALASDVLLNSPCESRAKRNITSRSRGGINVDLLERQLFIHPHSEGQQDTTHREKELKDNSEDSTLALVPVSPTEPTSPIVHLRPDSTSTNILDLFEGRISSIVSLNALHKPSDRLALIGGAEGVLGNMAAKGVSPDVRTLTLLVDMMESGYSSLQVLLKVAKRHRVKLDIAFFNSAIYRAAKASDAEGSKSVLSVMRQRNVGVNVQTFGCLALGCEREKDGLQLLKDMEEAGLRPNAHVFSALIGRAVRRLDYIYLKTILKTMADKEVWPNETIIRQLEFVAQYPPSYDKYKSRNNYLVHIDGFRGYYQEWLKRMPAQSNDGEQEDSEAVGLLTQAGEELSEAQRNQRAAARRFQTRNHKERNNGPALQQHSQSF